MDDLKTGFSAPHARIIIQSTYTELGRVRDFVRDFCAPFVPRRFSETKIEKLVIAANEVTVNIIQHGYSGEGHHHIWISAKDEGHSVVIAFVDHGGKPFDPESVPDPHPGQIGGYGIDIIKQCVDIAEYLPMDNSRTMTRLVVFSKNSG